MALYRQLSHRPAIDTQSMCTVEKTPWTAQLTATASPRIGPSQTSHRGPGGGFGRLRSRSVAFGNARSADMRVLTHGNTRIIECSLSYNEKLWMLDLLKAVTYPPS
jgi:hypothetical protein